jgi:alkylhydroperoxidase/carboxymuconolactone decarboxylase family protein YurZ
VAALGTREDTMADQSLVLDTLTAMTTAAGDRTSLAPRELMLVRLAALMAVDAPPVSYLANAEAAEASGLNDEDIQGIMVAVAPIVGTAKVASAAGKILRALGVAIAVADAELADSELADADGIGL